MRDTDMSSSMATMKASNKNGMTYEKLWTRTLEHESWFPVPETDYPSM
jgi:hypothetical protein